MADVAGGTCYRIEPHAIVLHVRLTPKGGRDAIDGVKTLTDGRPVALARVRVAPDKGAANAALLALIADALRVPKSAVSLAAGATARLKQVRIAGDPAVLARLVDEWTKLA